LLMRTFPVGEKHEAGTGLRRMRCLTAIRRGNS
jgi:hypothetical protein